MMGKGIFSGIALVMTVLLLPGCRSAGPSVPHRGAGTEVREKHAWELNEAFRKTLETFGSRTITHSLS